MQSLKIFLIFIPFLSNWVQVSAIYDHLSPDEAKRIAVEAYIYGYSLVTSEVTRLQMTNTSGSSGLRTPMGVFNNLRSYPPATYHGVVAPNADTLYSIAWIDLDREPWLFSYPDMNNRYYLFPIYTLWMSILDDPGIRTTGSTAGTYALVGPNWNRPLPLKIQNMIRKTIYSTSRYILILGRTYCNGTEEDYRIVHQLQDQYLLRPLSIFLHNQTKTYDPYYDVLSYSIPDPPFNDTGSVREVIRNMNISTYFNIMSARMIDNPPSTDDLLMVIQMARIGLIPGTTFSLNSFNSSVKNAFLEASKIALDIISAYKIGIGVIVNNWIILNDTGSFGAHYLLRAAVAYYGWGANEAADAIYPSTNLDSNAQILSGMNQYTLHFSANQTPPVRGFWSFTMYDQDLFLVPNSLNKYTISSRDTLLYNADGSLDLYLQNRSPEKGKQSNWLPAPNSVFNIMLRMYWPEVTVHDIVKGTWQIPCINKVS